MSRKRTKKEYQQFIERVALAIAREPKDVPQVAKEVLGVVNPSTEQMIHAAFYHLRTAKRVRVFDCVNRRKRHIAADVKKVAQPVAKLVFNGDTKEPVSQPVVEEVVETQADSFSCTVCETIYSAESGAHVGFVCSDCLGSFEHRSRNLVLNGLKAAEKADAGHWGSALDYLRNIRAVTLEMEHIARAHLEEL
jgi:hypothetical protein